MVIVVKLHAVIDEVNRDAEAVPLHWKNDLFHLQNIVEHILVNVKKDVSNFDDHHCKLHELLSKLEQTCFDVITT